MLRDFLDNKKSPGRFVRDFFVNFQKLKINSKCINCESYNEENDCENFGDSCKFCVVAFCLSCGSGSAFAASKSGNAVSFAAALEKNSYSYENAGYDKKNTSDNFKYSHDKPPKITR